MLVFSQSTLFNCRGDFILCCFQSALKKLKFRLRPQNNWHNYSKQQKRTYPVFIDAHDDGIQDLLIATSTGHCLILRKKNGSLSA